VSFLNLGEIVETNDGSLTLRHPQHGECYHSFDGAYLEARELYILRSGFCESIREKKVTSVLDVGLGLAYNAMASIEAWWTESESFDLVLTSLEINPDLVSTMAAIDGSWQSGWTKEWLGFCAGLKELDHGSSDYKKLITELNLGNTAENLQMSMSTPRIWQAVISHPVSGSCCVWRVMVADARHLPNLPNQLNFIWQDPFSPEKNPDMWSETWFSKLAKHCEKGAVLMSYSVARVTRDALKAAGFNSLKISTATKKRSWLKAIL